MKSLLVVGVRPGSLGAAVAEAGEEQGWEVTTAGIKGEDVYLDLTLPGTVKRFMFLNDFNGVVCTAGINPDSKVGAINFSRSLREALEVNTLGPLCLAESWVDTWRDKFKNYSRGPEEEYAETTFTFAAVSSNSAHIARSRSTAYCASKAALSMGLRCLARAVAEEPFTVMGWEPGWLAGTTMSKQVMERLQVGVPPHRIPGNREIYVPGLAHAIVTGLVGGNSLNGCMIRIDGGEQ